MIVKGIIKSIDYSGNTCTVRIPVFESAANENEVVVPATLSTLPGIYNGYKEEDVVFIAFENNNYDMPIVIGKLYLGVETEKNDPRGAIVCNNITAAQPISIPISSQLTLDNDPQHSSIIGVDKGIDSYKSIADLAKNLQKQDEKLGSLSVKVIDDGENLGAEIAKKVSITDETTKQRGLGWNLNTEKWEVYAKDSVGDSNKIDKFPIMTIDRTGTVISGNLVLTGYPQTTEIKYTNSPDKNTPPTGDDVKWQDNTKDLYTDEHYIWKRTREVFYAYNAETDKWELTKYGDAHYECITGAKGDAGYTTVTVMLYKRSKTSISGKQIDVDLYYKFSDQKLYKDKTLKEEYKLPTGWSYTISGTGDSSNGDLYCIAAVARSNTESDKILLDEWVGPTLYVENGADGKPGVYIKEVKQWYILKASSFPEPGSEQTPESIKPEDNAEPTYDPAPTSTTLDEWMSTPPEAVNGYNIWTCYGSIFSDDIPSDSKKRHIEYSIPVKDAAYALAQGKTTNYYSPTEPVNKIKIGDCWFDTGYVKITPTPDKKAGYLGKFIISADGNISVNQDEHDADRYIPAKSSSTKLIKVTPDNIDTLISNKTIVVGTTEAFETGNLKQCSSLDANGKATWTDIAGELVTNKLTAKYIDAMDITTKKITVLDKNNDTLFEADGTKTIDENGQVIKDSRVTIAGWNATKDSLVGGDEETGTYTKIQIPNANTNAANSLVSPFDLFELKVLTGDTNDTGGTLTDYSLVQEGQIKLRKKDESSEGKSSKSDEESNKSNPLLERDNYYAWDIIPKSDNDASTSNPPPHLAIVKLTYKNDTPLYNFNIYLSGLFNTVLVDGKETSVNFIAATDIFNIGKIKEYGYIGESQLLEVLCYTNYSNGKWNPPPSKLNPLYVLTMDNTSLFYTGKVNYVYPQINKGDWLYIIQYVKDPKPKKIPGATSTGMSTAYDDIQTSGNSVEKYNRGTFFIERKIDTSKNVFDVSSNFRVSELGNLQSRQSLRAYNTVRADKIECGSWKLWPEQLMKEDFELRSNQIKLATARSAKFYDKTTLTMRVRSNTQADEAAKASDSANTVISQGELSCDHALCIRGKNHIRLSALDAMPTTDAEAQMVISAIPGQKNTQESMVCAAMAVSSEVLTLGGVSESSGQELSVSSVPGIGDITKPDITKPGMGGIIIKPSRYTRIKIKVACIPNVGYSIISSPRYVTVYCLCKGKTYTIKGLLGGDKLSFEETITVMDKVENPLSTDTLKFRWATYGSWSSQTKAELTTGYPRFEDTSINGTNSCSKVNVITITRVDNVTKTVGFNSNVIPLTSHAYSLGDTDYYWTGVYAQEGVKTSSDLRLKKDIKQLTAQDFSAFYDKLQPVSFRFKTDDDTASTRLGFIAQDVETALAETDHADLGIVSKPESENGYYGLRYEQFIMLNMLQIKQLKKDLASLRQKYDALEKALDQKNQKER